MFRGLHLALLGPVGAMPATSLLVASETRREERRCSSLLTRFEHFRLVEAVIMNVNTLQLLAVQQHALTSALANAKPFK